MSRRLLVLLIPLLATIVAARNRSVRQEINVPTFNKEIVRILQQNCQSCHHPGDVAPFSLMTFDEAYQQRHLIRFMTQTRQMPPWKPAQGCGEFKDVRRLTDQQIDLMARWVDAGAPQGNPADLPAPLVFKDGWAEGQPDLVLTMPEAYTPPSDREMYRCFPIPAGTSERKWVSAIDVRPGDRQSVHHVIAFVDSTGASVSLDQQDPGPGYQCFGGPGFTTVEMLGGWAPGTRPNFLPDGVGLSLAANSRVVLQVHYHPHGTAPVADSTEIGIYYSDKPVEKELRLLPLANTEFTIPAGHSNYEVNATFTTPIFFSGRLYVIFPHMHLLGKRMKVDATVIGGQNVCLIDIPDWDFKWQGGYAFKDPVPLPGGTRLDMRAWYDNSANNPRNPNNPPKPVSWGEATTDEMALVFLGFTLD